MLAYKFFKLILVMYWNSIGIEFASQLRRVLSTIDIRNLCSRKCDYLIVGIASEIGVEIVKIAACCADNDNFLRFYKIY